MRRSRRSWPTPWTGSPGTCLEGFRTVPLDRAANAESDAWRRRLRLADWFDGPAVTVEGIPFARVAKGPDLAATSLRAKSELRVPARGKATEVYLLLAAVLAGPEEPAYGAGKLRAIRDVDRFRVRLEYADGTADECLPMGVVTRRFGVVPGVQVVVAAADPSKELAGVVLCDRCKQGAFALAGVTLRTDGKRAFPEALEEGPPALADETADAGREPAIAGRHGRPAAARAARTPAERVELPEGAAPADRTAGRRQGGAAGGLEEDRRACERVAQNGERGASKRRAGGVSPLLGCATTQRDESTGG